MNMIFVDFQNADKDGFLLLNTWGTFDDLKKLNVVLLDGLRLVFHDGEVGVQGVVRSPGTAGIWRGEIDWAAITPDYMK